MKPTRPGRRNPNLRDAIASGQIKPLKLVLKPVMVAAIQPVNQSTVAFADLKGVRWHAEDIVSDREKSAPVRFGSVKATHRRFSIPDVLGSRDAFRDAMRNLGVLRSNDRDLTCVLASERSHWSKSRPTLLRQLEKAARGEAD